MVLSFNLEEDNFSKTTAQIYVTKSTTLHVSFTYVTHIESQKRGEEKKKHTNMDITYFLYQ